MARHALLTHGAEASRAGGLRRAQAGWASRPGLALCASPPATAPVAAPLCHQPRAQRALPTHCAETGGAGRGGAGSGAGRASARVFILCFAPAIQSTTILTRGAQRGGGGGGGGGRGGGAGISKSFHFVLRASDSVHHNFNFVFD
jgi:hypothetical protein